MTPPPTNDVRAGVRVGADNNWTTDRLEDG